MKPQNFTYYSSTLVQVMTWCHQATWWHQAITCTIVDDYHCHHMGSIGHNYLTQNHKQMIYLDSVLKPWHHVSLNFKTWHLSQVCSVVVYCCYQSISYMTHKDMCAVISTYSRMRSCGGLLSVSSAEVFRRWVGGSLPRLWHQTSAYCNKFSLKYSQRQVDVILPKGP